MTRRLRSQNGRAYFVQEPEPGVRYSLWSVPPRCGADVVAAPVLRLPIDEQQAPTAGSDARARELASRPSANGAGEADEADT